MYIRENIVNMSNYYVISRQLIVMFMFMTLGYLMYRNKMIDNCGAKSIGNLLIYVVLPCSILSSFINNSENISYKLLVYSIILSILMLYHSLKKNLYGTAFILGSADIKKYIKSNTTCNNSTALMICLFPEFLT